MAPELDDDVSREVAGDFLDPADFKDGIRRRFTIAVVDKHIFEASNGRPEESKRKLVFNDDHCLSLNKTNLRLLAKWFGKKPSAWVGKDVSIYRDESVSFGGRMVGGWRLSKPSAHDPVGLADDNLSGSPF